MAIEIEDVACPPWYMPPYEEHALRISMKYMLEAAKPARIQEFTHDLPLLLKKENHFLFVYGTLRRGKSNHSLTQRTGIQYIGRGLTKANNYAMFQSGVPVVLPIPEKSKIPKGHIYGELYKVPTRYMPEFDALEGNGTVYQRRKTRIQLAKEPHHNLENHEVTAWMYHGLDHYFCNSITGKQYTASKLCVPNDPKKKDKQYYVFIEPS